MQIDDLVKNVAINTLKDSPIYESLQEDMEHIYKYQEALYHLASDPDGIDLKAVKIGTILSFSIVGKIIQGKNPKKFSPEDWKDVADKVADYAVIMDGQKYTEFVFNLFAVYIDMSVSLNENAIKETDAAEILGLATEIRDLTGRLDEGEITEPDYVDRCLWTSLEAMIKLLAAYKTKKLCEEYAFFIKAVADFSVQYGRYKLYEYELNLLNSYLEDQQKLDMELERKYNDYIEQLQEESDEFNNLIENAFSEDFEDMLKDSVSLARKAGVDEDKILNSKDKIDSFFMM